MAPNDVKREEIESFKDQTNSKLTDILLKVENIMGRVTAIENDMPDYKNILVSVTKIEEKIDNVQRGAMTKKEIASMAIAAIFGVSNILLVLFGFILKGS